MFQADMQSKMTSAADVFEMFKSMTTPGYYLAVGLGFVSNIILISIIYTYIAKYVESGSGNFTIEEVWQFALRNTGMVFVTSLLTGLIVIAGIVLVIIPGIWLSIVLSIIIYMRIIEKNSFSEAFSRCFDLVRGNWWWTFLLIVVLYIVASLCAMVFQMPQLILTQVVVLNSGSISDWKFLFTVFSAIGVFFSSILNVLPMIGIAFQYHSLIDKHESPNLRSKIAELRESDDQTNQNIGW